MSEIAYGNRNKTAIKLRSAFYFLYIKVRKIIQEMRGKDRITVNEIFTYPAIQSRDELADFLNRLAWGFPNKENLNLNVSVTRRLMQIDISKLKTPPVQRNYLTKLPHVNLVTSNKLKMSEVDLILITKVSISLANPLVLSNIHRTLLADKYFSSIEESQVWQSGFYRTFTKNEIQGFEANSRDNFVKLLEKNNNKTKAYCFATGPSFDRFKEFDYGEKSFKVICNSIVKNEEFLEYINGPDLLVFSDPVFHFSPCEYSAQFRDNIIEVVRKYKCFVTIPNDTVPLMLAHYPELKNYLIGMPTKKEFNIPSLDAFYVKRTANILTLYMIPMASAISDKIYIIGADGRKPDEKYFWNHSSSAQYNDLMQTAFKTHPSFFRDRDYRDYYEEHCFSLEKLIEYGESLRKQYISLTPSFIPALKIRQN